MKKKNIILASLITGIVLNNNTKSRELNNNNRIKYESEVGKEVDIELIDNKSCLEEIRIERPKKILNIDQLNNINYPNLKVLQISLPFYPEISIKSVESIGSINTLEELVLNRCKITDITFLKHLTQLEVLNLRANKIIDITPLQKLEKLKNLDLGQNEIIDITHLQTLEKLKNLDLGQNEIIDITPLQNLEKLEMLDLRFNKIKNITPLQKLTKIEILNLVGNLDLGDITLLKNLNKLKNLALASTGITNFDLNSLQTLTQLEELYLGTNKKITAITPLKTLEQLKVLDLSFSKITDITPLHTLTQLKELNLWENKITDITPLRTLTQLKKLNLRDNKKITDITPLHTLTQLEELNLRDTNISSDKINNLKEILPNTEIDFSKINSSKSKSKSKISYLNSENKETFLFKVDCCLEKIPYEYIRFLEKNNKKIESLDVKDSKIKGIDIIDFVKNLDYQLDEIIINEIQFNEINEANRITDFNKKIKKLNIKNDGFAESGFSSGNSSKNFISINIGTFRYQQYISKIKEDNLLPDIIIESDIKLF